MTRDEIERTLLAGLRLTFGEKNDSSIELTTSRSRRLAQTILNALLTNDVETLKESQAFFDSLQAADSDDFDPAKDRDTEVPQGLTDIKNEWRLSEVTTRGFGGLNSYKSEPFELDVNSKNWILEGQNGSGKSSLINAMIFAMTGKIYRDQRGVIENPSHPDPVLNDQGIKVADWPSVAAYPNDWILDTGDVDVISKLVFVDDTTGETAVATCRHYGTPTQVKIEHYVDPKLQRSQVLIETGLLMPMRLHHLRLVDGDDNQQIVALIRQLIGLDPLINVAELAEKLTDGRQRFLKFATDHKNDLKKSAFSTAIDKAQQALSDGGSSTVLKMDIDQADIVDRCNGMISEFSKSQKEALGVVSQIAFQSFDPSDSKHREAVIRAVQTISTDLQRAKAADGTPSVLRDLGQLCELRDFGQLSELENTIKDAALQLKGAIEWSKRQETDVKLRLKAIASSHFDHVDGAQPDCPLCEQPLKLVEHSALISDLDLLKKEAEIAQTKLDDACRQIKETVNAKVSEVGIPAALRQPERYSINELVVADATRRFLETTEVKQTLPGLEESAKRAIDALSKSLPPIVFGSEPATDNQKTPQSELERLLRFLEDLILAPTVWAKVAATYQKAWEALLNTETAGSLGELLSDAKTAVNSAEPFRKASESIETAKSLATQYRQIQSTQKLRESLVEEIRLLRPLRNLVNELAADTVRRLSGAAMLIHEEIQNIEALGFKGADVSVTRGKQSVGFYAKPNCYPGSDDELTHWKLDATLLANSSWMRGILWSFVFALRDEAIRAIGHCPFPLMALDDPQMTFDARNRKNWARQLGKMAGGESSVASPGQIFITTHDREFATFFLHEKSFLAGGIERGFGRKGTTQIAHGDFAEVRFNKAVAENSDERASHYIGTLRVLAETLLKHAIAEFAPQTLYSQDHTLGSIRREFIRSGISEKRAPYTDPAFIAFDEVASENGPVMKLLSEPHHQDSDKITVKQAQQAREFWRARLYPAIDQIWSQFRLHRKRTIGELAAIQVPANANHQPHVAAGLNALKPKLVGRVSAFTDSRASLGYMSFAAAGADAKTMSLAGLAAYRLERDTLSPVADVGDILLVHMKPGANPRNLVVEDRGTFLAARRFERDPNYGGIAVLTAAASDPKQQQDAIFTREAGGNRRKVVSVLFSSHLLTTGSPVPVADEVSPIDIDIVVRGLLANVDLVEVIGDSAQPKALDRQHLLVQQERTDLVEACKELDGRPVVVLDQNDEAYFKRLRHVGAEQVALESLDAAGRGGLILLSLGPSRGGRPSIRAIRPVAGVVFDWLA